MTAGGPGDHPLSDVLDYGIDVYGAGTDGLLSEPEQPLSRREPEVFWVTETGWQCDNTLAGRQAASNSDNLETELTT